MVKFGKHLEVFAETDDTAGLFVVPYNEIKAKIRHNDTSDDRRSLFEELWRSNLNQASQEFASLTQDFLCPHLCPHRISARGARCLTWNRHSLVRTANHGSSAFRGRWGH